jgi:hypothetical protein
MEDSGKRTEFSTGAVRDTAEGKSRPDLISPYAQMREGGWLAEGARKYAERNWEKGMLFSRCIASICRHLFQYMLGMRNEDHLAAIRCNAGFLMHYEAMISAGRLPADLDDMPKYELRGGVKEAYPAGVKSDGVKPTEYPLIIKAILKSSYPKEQQDKIIGEIREIAKDTKNYEWRDCSRIEGCFVWDKTPQGSDYWKNITTQLELEGCYDD